MDIVNAYAELGSYRAAAAECGTTHRTVKKVIERLRAGDVASRHPRPRNTDGVADLIAEKVRVTTALPLTSSRPSTVAWPTTPWDESSTSC